MTQIHFTSKKNLTELIQRTNVVLSNEATRRIREAGYTRSSSKPKVLAGHIRAEIQPYVESVN